MATPRKRKSRETPRAIPLAKATEQRARLASAQADLAELKAAALRGDLLDAAAVEREWAGCCAPCAPACWPFHPASARGFRI